MVTKTKQTKEERLQKIKEWTKNNPEKRKAAITKYHETHKEKEKQYNLANKDKIATRSKKWREENKVYSNKLQKQNRQDPAVKMRHTVSVLIRHSLKGIKDGSIADFLPYTIDQLKEHIQSLFEPWMTWENHGRYVKETWNDDDSSTWTWQLDHIVRQANLPYVSMEDDNFKKCWSLDNLRPLSAKQNILENFR